MKVRYIVYIAAFFTIKTGIQYSGFEDGGGTAIVIGGVALLAIAIYLSIRAKKAKTSQTPQA
jgi:hypothetical protein